MVPRPSKADVLRVVVAACLILIIALGPPLAPLTDLGKAVVMVGLAALAVISVYQTYAEKRGFWDWVACALFLLVYATLALRVM